jgi:hypothetical protein
VVTDLNHAVTAGLIREHSSCLSKTSGVRIGEFVAAECDRDTSTNQARGRFSRGSVPRAQKDRLCARRDEWFRHPLLAQSIDLLLREIVRTTLESEMRPDTSRRRSAPLLTRRICLLNEKIRHEHS